MTILITGSAGFIGFHLVRYLVDFNVNIVGIDNINDYYDVNLKYDRLRECGVEVKESNDFNYSTIYSNYKFVKGDIADKRSIDILFAEEKFDLVINLAAQAGVRYSIENPYAYASSNLIGFLNILEACRNYHCTKLIYASSSSVYGNSDDIPFQESQNVDSPVSFYAATKKSNELMAYTYSNLFGLDTVGLRFFTVYGSWGRPDMAPMLFAKEIVSNGCIKVFNQGNLSRDFTYIDDIILGIYKIVNNIDDIKGADIYNIGHGVPVKLLDFIKTLEKTLGMSVCKEFVGMQDGDVKITYADINKIARKFGYVSTTALEEGIIVFVEWYKKYYSL